MLAPELATSLTDLQIGHALLQAEPDALMLSPLHPEVGGIGLPTPPGSAQGDQSLEQVHPGAGVHAQSRPAMSPHSTVSSSIARMDINLTNRIGREKKHRKCNFDLLTAVHETEYRNVKRPIDPETKRPLEPAHRFEVNIEGDSVSQAKYELFLKYQTKVHREDVSRWKIKDFQRFLCSGIKRSPAKLDKSNESEKKLGSWHQCYRLDGKLIAVAVLDLVPGGVSSVYIL